MMMKKVLISFGLLLLCAAATRAQQPKLAVFVAGFGSGAAEVALMDTLAARVGAALSRGNAYSVIPPEKYRNELNGLRRHVNGGGFAGSYDLGAWSAKNGVSHLCLVWRVPHTEGAILGAQLVDVAKKAAVGHSGYTGVSLNNVDEAALWLANQLSGRGVDGGLLGGRVGISSSQTLPTYTVAYNANGGTGSMSSSSHVYGTTKALTANSLSRTGYTFKSWNTSADGTGTTYTDGQPVTNLTDTADATVTLYAQWAANAYTITLNASGGNGGAATVTATYGAALPAFAVPTATGYTLMGYFTEVWDGAKVINADGTLVSSVSGYTDAAGKWIHTADAETLHAQWETNTYTITLNANGGSGGAATVTATYNIDLPAFTAPTLTGYVLTGYFTASSGGEKVINANGMLVSSVSGYTDVNGSWINTAAATLYAQWTANAYTIALDANGGNENSSATAIYDAALPAFTAPTRTGYTIAGYFTASSGGEKVINANGTLVAGVSGYTDASGSWVNAAIVTLYAQWKANAYTITLNANGGSANSSVTATYDAALSTFTAPTRTGYAIAGYFTESWGGEKVISANGTLVSNVLDYTNASGSWVNATAVTLYAQWTANAYTITLNANGGSGGAATVTATYGAALPAFTTPKLMAYTIAGYFTASSGGEKVIDAYGTLVPSVSGYTDASGSWVNAAAVTLYAQWTANAYTITLEKNNGSANSSIRAIYGASLPAFTAPTLRGYTLIGYFTANWDGEKVINANGTLVSSVSGYTDASGSWINATDVTLYAQWEANTYTITLNANGGGGGAATVTATYEVDLPAFTAPTRTGYTLAGHFTEKSGGTKVIKANGKLVSSVSGYTDAADNWINTSAATLYAQWTANACTIMLNANNGRGEVSTVKATYDAALPAFTIPTRTGYAIAGYFTAESGGTKMINANGTLVSSVSGYTDAAGKWISATDVVTLYAQWTANTYTITLNANGGSGGAATVTATYNAALPAFTAPTLTGYMLTGYFTASSGGEKVINANGTLVSRVFGYTNASGSWVNAAAVTLYAQWEVKTYTITLNANGGSANSSVRVTYGAALPAFTALMRMGYTLTGYFTASSGGEKVINANNMLVAGVSGYTDASGSWINAADVTLYAQWKVKTYTITLNANGGSGGSADVTATYDAALPAFTAPTRTTHALTGYFTEKSGNLKVINANSTLVPSVSGYTDASGNWVNDCDIILYAHWMGNAYTITLNANGGSANSSITAIYGASLFAFTAPTRRGYEIAGYFTASSGGTKVISADGMLVSSVSGYTDANGSWANASAVTLYAQWTANTYKITLNANGGDANSSVKATYDAALPTFIAPTRTGYTVAGYFTESSGGEKVINANGTLVPSVPGYTDASGSWVNIFTVILYAQWTANAYPITLNANGGSANSSVRATYGETLPTFTAPTRTGYTLAGYFTASSGGTKMINANGTLVAGVSGYTEVNGKWINAAAITLYAQWTADAYTITLNANGGSVNNSVTATYGEALPTFTAPTLRGYSLTGYFTENWDGTKVINVNGTLVSSVSGYTDAAGKWIHTAAATVLHAQWKANAYTITLNANGGGGGAATVTAKYEVNLPAFTAPTRTGYTLTGYFTASSGGTKIINANGTLVLSVSGYTDANGSWVNTSSVTLYAQWTANTI